MMTAPGTLIGICGPSGAGKDTVLRLAMPLLAGNDRLVLARRCITRAPGPGEDNTFLSAEAFAQGVAGNGFLLHWHANGLDYALPGALRDDLAEGRSVLANFSRGIIPAARALPYPLVMIEISASPEVLAGRLARRGREDLAGQQSRLARNALYAGGVGADHIVLNDGTPEEAAARLAALVQMVLADAAASAA